MEKKKMDCKTARVVIAVGILFSVPARLLGQARDADEEMRWFAGFPSWTVELNAGLAYTSRFLLQSLDGPDGVVPQRSLEADPSFSYGGAVGATILPRTALRLSFTRTSADLDYNEDSGTGNEVFDIDDVGKLTSNVLSLEAIRYLLPARIRITPYGGLGVSVIWWNLGEKSTPALVVAGDDETEFRTGVSAVFGGLYRVSERWGIQLDVTAFSLGNPFTGDSSYVPLTGFTIDEPERIRQTNLRIGASYTFDTP